jgi:hypothetical protein
MGPTALRTSSAAVLAALLVAAPAAADPGTTGGLPAGEPLFLTESGGLEGPALVPGALAATASPDAAPTTQADSEGGAPGKVAAQTAQSDQGDSRVEVPVTGDDNAAAPAPTAPVAGARGGGLPHTGLGLAGLAAVGLGLLLAGVALRPVRP